MDEIKQRALELANDPSVPPETVVERAQRYEQFLRSGKNYPAAGEGAGEPGTDGYPDALTG